jgi:Ig-like domain CHU_C associated/Lectin C-type domain/HYR domain
MKGTANNKKNFSLFTSRAGRCLLAGILFFTGVTCGTAQTHIQTTTSFQTTTSATISKSFASPGTTGNLIVVELNWDGQTRSISGVTDNKGNTYAKINGPTNWNGTNYRAELWYAYNITGGGTAINITATLSGAPTSFSQIYISEYSGIITTNPLDQNSVATGNTPAISSGAKTTTFANELIYGASIGASGTISTGTGFTNRSAANQNIIEDKNVTATGSYDAIFTIPPGGNRWIAQMATFIANNITTGAITGSPFCAGNTVSVPFTIQGNFVTGNVFTAQLSDAGGSFASPVTLGTLTQNTAGTIAGTIPAGTLAGSGYRIRVVGSSPAVTGSVNGSALIINAPATVTPGSTLTACQSAAPSPITLTGAGIGGGAGTGAWSVTAGGGTLSSTAQTATPAAVTYTPAVNFSGTVTLTLTTNDPAGPCGAVAATRTINVNPSPLNIAPAAAAATVCSGTGTTIQITASQSGINYQLRNNAGNVNIGSAVPGTGGNINLPTGNLTSTTVFNVLATDNITGCFLQLSPLVTVSTDNIAPVINCPATQNINLDASCSATMPSFTGMATVSDNCTPAGSITVTQSPAAGTSLVGAGTQVVTLTATDASGNISNCTFNLTKADVTPPVIACPASITVNSPAGACGAVVNYAISATDNCSANSACVPASLAGYTLVGTYGGHTYFRSNFSAGWATAKANAIALGGHLLTLSSAGENALFNGLGSHWAGFTDEAVEGTFVWVTGEPVVYTNWAPAEPNDYNGNEDYMQLNWNASFNWNDYNGATSFPYVIEFDCASYNLTMVSGLASGSVFPVGTTIVTYSASDYAGNTSPNCSFTVTVNDVTPPTIQCPANINVNAAAGTCGAAVSYSTPVVTENCANCGTPPAVSGFTYLGAYNGGAYYISNTTVDGPTAFTSANSLGATLPNISSAGENTFLRNAATAAGFAGSYYIGVNDVVTEGNFTGYSGETLLYTNWNSGEPNNSGNEDYVQVFASGLWNDIKAANLYNYVIRFNCMAPVLTSGLASGSTFPVGINTVTYAATDPSGNSVNCSFTVTVADNIAPVITCPGTQNISLDNSCGAVMPGFTSMATVSDNCTPSGSITVTQSPAAGTSLSGAGIQVITLTATDASGNSGTCTFNLNKQDVTPPVMNCPANITVNAAAGVCGAVVNYTVTATDNCSGTFGCAPASIPGYTLIGTYGGHTYFRSNAGTTWATANTNATALGAHLVTIGSAGENSFFAGLGSHWAGFTDQAVEGTFVWVTGEPVVYTSWNGGEPNNSGGNENYMQLNFSGTNWNDANGGNSYPSVIEFDCLNVNMVAGLVSGSVFPVGTTTVTYNATDIAGNTSLNCSFTVTVNDVTLPTIVCPANIAVNAPAGTCSAVVNYNPPVATDNCGNCGTPPSLSGMTLLGTYNGKGYYISGSNVTWSAANTAAAAQGGYLTAIDDAAENTYILNRVATVIGSGTNYWIGLNDAVAEGTYVWANGQPFSYSNWQAGQPDNSGGNEDYAHVWTAAGTWNDAAPGSTMRYVLELPCVPVTLTSGLASGAAFPLGISTINYSAADASGNTSNCSFTITVSVNPASLNKTVTAASANICINTGTNITVALSDNGVSYQLRDNATNTNIGSPVAGTGGTISLPTGNLTSTTTFNVFATAGSCSYQLTNTATVTVIPLPADKTPVAAAAAVCSGTGTNIQIASSQSGVNYQLRNNATNANVGSAVAGTGGTINLPTGNLASNTIFNVLATTATASCSIQMINTVTVTVNPLPATPAAGDASRCGTGTVTIAATPGSGETIDWYAAASGGAALVTGNTSFTTPSISSTTLYYAQARNTATGCLSAARRTVTATVNAVPTNYSITGGGSYCTGGSGVAIGVSGSDAGTTYQLFRGATSVSSKPGTGSAVSFGNSIIAGTYTVVATTSAGCPATMTGTATVSVNSLPQVSVFSGNNICSYATGQLTLTASSGVSPFTVVYNDGSTNQTVSGVSSGTAFNVSPNPGSTTNYTLVNVTDNNGCLRNSGFTDGSATITLLATPADKALTAVSTTVCSGSSANIQINTSQSGVNYQLRNNATNALIGGAVAGTGGTINLPTGALSAATTFNVLATNASSACNIQLSSTITINVNPAGQWIGGSSGNWNTAANWCGGIPANSTNVNIPAGTAVSIQTANAVANSVTIAGTGSLIMTGAYNLSITAGGTFINNGTFDAAASTGTVAFAGNGTISGTTTFKNIDTYGALDFGTASTVSGTFSLQTGGSVTGNSPYYTCPSALLLYKPGSTFARGLEWTSSSSGAGYPANVQVQNNTTINFPVGGDGFVCYDLTIDNGSSLMQNYSGGSASIRVGRNITINGMLSLGNASGGDIYAGGNWTRNTGGVFNHNDRKVIFDGPSNFSGNGTSMSTITAPASAAKDNEGGFGGESFAHIRVNKTNATDSVVLLSNITVNREIELIKGTFSLRNSDVTLVSNSTRTADVAPVTPANVTLRYAGTGRFVVQRFIQNPTAARSWRVLTAPLQSASAPSINQAWQEGVVNPDKTNPDGSGGIYNPWPGFGTHITGPGGTYSAANGFDHGTNAASVLFANTGVTAWSPPASSITTKITDKQGWMLFVRGARNFKIGGPYVPSENTTLEPKGKINTGNVVIPVVPGNQVIGNPYASAISLLNTDVAGTAGKNSNYYAWDPKMFTASGQLGKWIAFTGVGTSFVHTSSQTVYPPNGTIESGEAFVIDAQATGNFTFHESDKLPLTSSLIGIANGRPMTPLSYAIFRSDIYTNSNGIYKLTDGVLNIFNPSYNNAIDGDDNKKFINFNTRESLSILKDSVKLAIEKRMDLQEEDTVFFAISKFNKLPYQFRFEATDFEPGYEAFLEDNFAATRTPVSMAGVTLCNFTFTDDSLSKAADRFRIVFKSIVPPLSFTSIKAWQQNKNIAVQWQVDNELNIKNYTVEKSTDGVHFEKVNITPVSGNGGTGNTYNWLDLNAENGDNYYRVMSTATNGRTLYSDIVKVYIAHIDGSVIVYPNPVTDGIIKLRFDKMEKGYYNVRLLNDIGQLIQSMDVDHTGSSNVHSLKTKGKRHLQY